MTWSSGISFRVFQTTRLLSLSRERLKIEFRGHNIHRVNRPGIQWKYFHPPKWPLGVFFFWGGGCPPISREFQMGRVCFDFGFGIYGKKKNILFRAFFSLTPIFLSYGAFWGNFQFDAVIAQIIRFSKSKDFLKGETKTFLLMCYMTIFDPKLQGSPSP